MIKTPQNSFEDRLMRIERIHADGGAFEATGSLGRSYYDATRHKHRRPLPWRGIAVLFLGLLLFKGTLLAQLGAPIYDARVDALAAGSSIERIGAWVLKPEPATRMIADLISPFIG
jgi:hypothetical protein